MRMDWQYFLDHVTHFYFQWPWAFLLLVLIPVFWVVYLNYRRSQWQRYISANARAAAKYDTRSDWQIAQAFADVGGDTALDAFSGSGVVSYLLKHQGYAVHSNDYLGFPGVVARAGVVNHATRLTEDDVATIKALQGPMAETVLARIAPAVAQVEHERLHLALHERVDDVVDTEHGAVALAPLLLEAAGEHELKGIPDRWRLYRVA